MKKLILLFLLIFSINLEAKGDDVKQMLSTYNANQARFYKQYRNTKLSDVGTISDIRSDIFGTGYVYYIRIDVQGINVLCQTYNQDLAASLNKEQKVGFSGLVYDVILNNLMVRSCEISNPKLQAVLKGKGEVVHKHSSVSLPVQDNDDSSERDSKEVEKYVSLIRNKIKQHVNKQLCGNDKDIYITFMVNLMPTGELIGQPRLISESGIESCDEAVKKAIVESQPLPVPTSADLFKELKDLNLTFRPNDSN